MALIPTIDDVTDGVIAQWYDRGSIERGTAYAAERRVTSLGAVHGSAKAVVKGSARNAYVSRVRWSAGPRGILLADECSCPLGGSCKHCVAVLLTARREAASTAVSGWRTTLAPLVDLAPGDGEATGAPLALEVSLPEPPWAHFGSLGVNARPVVRPLRRGAQGRWVKTGASWRDIASTYRYGSNAALDPAQCAVLREIPLSARNASSGVSAGTVSLSSMGSDVWYYLRRATEAGIVLVDGTGDEAGVVVSSSPTSIEIDLTTGADGTVTVRTRLCVAGVPLPLEPGSSGLLGNPAHGVFTRTGKGPLHLVSLSEPLHVTVGALLTAPPLDIPAEDVDEFLDEYQPTLDRFATVRSSDGSVVLARRELAGLALEVDRSALDRASLRWAVRYRRGDHEVTYPLGDDRRRGRDSAAERALLDRLEVPTDLLPALGGADGRPRDLSATGRDTITLLTQVVPWFEQQGVAVEVLGGLPVLREATEDPLISLAVAEADAEQPGGTDWFDLSIEVSVGGEHVEFAALFSALVREEPVLFLPSGAWLSLDRPELGRLRELIEEARGLAEHQGEAAARINPFQTSWFEELAQLGVVQKQSDRWAASVARMRDLHAPEPIAPPPGLQAALRPYQQEGLDWLAFLHRNRLGGILADDMGLGKTVQALALCLHVLAAAPDARFLVVAPTSVVDNWRREAARFAPDIEVCAIRETAARRGVDLSEAIGDARLVVTSYALFRIEFEAYQQLDWEVLLLDEAQFVKNHTGKTYQCVRRLDANVKVAVTGTPLENSLMDLWSLLSIVAPGLYPDPKRFSDVYRKPIESGNAPELLGVLRRRIAPLMRRRTKGEVLSELPPKSEQTIEVALSARHARIYQTQLQRERQKVLGLVTDVQRNRFEILKSLTLLRQLSLDPGLVDPSHDQVGSAKLDRLVDDLLQVVAEGHRALVFSQFTRYLARVRKRLDDAGISHAYLDGRTRNREQAIAAFKDGGLPVFVISLKAGGFGLNLTEADYCFVLDPWWNPAVETQAVDRTHRIGQRNTVMVYRYVSAGTIEEKVMELKARKAALFASVMDADGALSGALTGDDIRGLLDLG